MAAHRTVHVAEVLRIALEVVARRTGLAEEAHHMELVGEERHTGLEGAHHTAPAEEAVDPTAAVAGAEHRTDLEEVVHRTGSAAHHTAQVEVGPIVAVVVHRTGPEVDIAGSASEFARSLGEDLAGTVAVARRALSSINTGFIIAKLSDGDLWTDGDYTAHDVLTYGFDRVVARSPLVVDCTP